MISSPKLDEVLWEDAGVALYRAHTGDGRALPMKVLEAARPTAAEYASLRREAIVEADGGSLAVESKEGVGPTLTVWLPLEEQES